MFKNELYNTWNNPFCGYINTCNCYYPLSTSEQRKISELPFEVKLHIKDIDE